MVVARTTFGRCVDALEQMAAVGLEILSLPSVASRLVVERQLGLVGKHEVAVVQQAGPMFFAARKVAVFDFVAALIEQLIADQVAGADLRVRRTSAPDSYTRHRDTTAWADAARFSIRAENSPGTQSAARKTPAKCQTMKTVSAMRIDQRGATAALRRAFALRRLQARFWRRRWRRSSRWFDRGSYHVVLPNMLLAECAYIIGRNTSVAPA